MQARFALRAGTEDVHRKLDETLSRLDLGKSGDYVRFLSIHARAVPPLEAALTRGGLPSLVEGWNAGRGAAIEADLAAVGLAMPPPVTAPDLDSDAELLGYAYVLEGSRLGGQLLRRRVAEGLPANYLDQASNTGPWAALLAALDRHLYSAAQVGEAKDAARCCFALFLNAAREAAT